MDNIAHLVDMIAIEDYIKLPLNERQSHLKLDEPCIERGGSIWSVSSAMRGVLAHVFDTTYPVGQTVLACHGCNNQKCSNLHHLYWGTPAENIKDSLVCGSRMNMWLTTVRKHGEEKAHEIFRNAARKGGQAGRGATKSQSHRENISKGVVAALERSLTN